MGAMEQAKQRQKRKYDRYEEGESLQYRADREKIGESIATEALNKALPEQMRNNQLYLHDLLLAAFIIDKRQEHNSSMKAKIEDWEITHAIRALHGDDDLSAERLKKEIVKRLNRGELEGFRKEENESKKETVEQIKTRRIENLATRLESGRAAIVAYFKKNEPQKQESNEQSPSSQGKWVITDKPAQTEGSQGNDGRASKQEKKPPEKGVLESIDEGAGHAEGIIKKGWRIFRTGERIFDKYPRKNK